MCIPGEPSVPHWPAGDSEAAQVVRSLNWAETLLGPVEGWPQSLKTAIELMLSCGFPSLIFWGRDAVLLCNDACAGVIGSLHPKELGRPFFEASPDSRAGLEPVLKRVLAGETVKKNGARYLITDGKLPREIWIDGHASPLERVAFRLPRIRSFVNNYCIP